MSEDFIPLNQSTPTSNRWQHQSRIHSRGIHVHYNQNQSFNQSGGGPSRSYNNNRRGNNSYRNSSFGSDCNNSSFNNCSQDGPPIDAYIHPAMLQDPWAQLRRKQNKS